MNRMMHPIAAVAIFSVASATLVLAESTLLKHSEDSSILRLVAGP